MIILTYISGLLTAMIIVLAIVSVRAYKKYTILLESNQHTLNISTIRTASENRKFSENAKKQLLNENLALRKNLDGLREDPNFTSRY